VQDFGQAVAGNEEDGYGTDFLERVKDHDVFMPVRESLKEHEFPFPDPKLMKPMARPSTLLRSSPKVKRAVSSTRPTLFG
jgi:hypothetical protein